MATTNVNDVSIFVVIPVYNRKSYTQECLHSLRKQTVEDFAVIVVDDGSTDGTSEMIQQEFPEVILLQGDGNLWWTGATNLGVQSALERGADYVITLNNDTVATQDFVEGMSSWAVAKPAALMGALALDITTNEPVYGGEILSWCKARGWSLLERLKPEERKGLHRVTHFPGRGLWIPAEVFKKVGLFDARHFPMTSADYDFTHRAMRAGYEIYCNYDSRIWIHVDASTTSSYRSEFSLRNYIRYLTDIRSAGNLKYFIFYVLRNCPVLCVPTYLILGLIVLIFGYPLHWLKSELGGTPKSTGA
jgi:GT2 family glycosyltransferase